MTFHFSKISFPTLAGASAIAALSLCAFPASAQNLVTNSTFDTEYPPWWTHADASKEASQTVAVTDGRLCSTIAMGGANTWDVILGLSDVALLKDTYYHIKFSATADTERSIRIKIGIGELPYTDYFIKTVKANPMPQVFEYTYLNLRDNVASQVQFHIGGSPGVVCVDDVVLEPVPAPVLGPYVTPSLTGNSLKAHAAVVKMGTAVDSPTFLSNPTHNAIVANEFSMITPANAMKMNIIQPIQGTFDWVDADALWGWATTNGLEFHGHPLVWHTQAPGWLTETEFDRDQMLAIMYAHIDALMGHFTGLPYWDVVNEAVEKTGDVWGFRPTIWHDRIGPDFMDLAFHHAAAIDPNTKLLYNDYNIEQLGNPKADYVFTMIEAMRSRGVPVHQVGFQTHYYVTPGGGPEGIPDVAKIRENMDRYARIGVDVQITECDFRIGKPLDDTKAQIQADFFRDVLQACIDAPNCSHFTVWGLSDYDSWVPSTFADYDYAHLYDANLAPKSSYHAMTDVFAKYNTDGSLKGCSMGPTRGGTNAPWIVGVLVGLALARRSRRTS